MCTGSCMHAGGLLLWAVLLDVVVIPTDRMTLGMLPSSAMTCRRETASTLPTTSFTSFGRYFSTCVQAGEGRRGPCGVDLRHSRPCQRSSLPRAGRSRSLRT